MGAKIKAGLLAMMILIVPNVYSAHFICGFVNDASDGTSAGWRDVKIYYDDENNYGTCQVSPENNKFCCDADAIPGYSWALGHEITAEVVDNGDGYFANSETVITTPEGFDNVPDMELKGFLIVIPSVTIEYTLGDEISYDITTIAPYTDSISYDIGDGEIILCEDCTSVTVDLVNLSIGSYTLKITASDASSNTKEKELEFSIVEEIVEEVTPPEPVSELNETGPVSVALLNESEKQYTNYVEIPLKPFFYKESDPNSGLHEIIFYPNSELFDVFVRGVYINTFPIDESLLPGIKIYQYIEVQTINLDVFNIERSNIRFKIPKEDLRGLDTESLIITSFKEDEELELPHTITDDDRYYFYEIEDDFPVAYFLYFDEAKVAIFEEEPKKEEIDPATVKIGIFIFIILITIIIRYVIYKKFNI